MWRKSTHSMSNGNCVEFRKSSHSHANGNCVEIAGGVQVRDSKDPDGIILKFDGVSWGKFIATLK